MLGPGPGGVFETCLKAIFEGLARFTVKSVCAVFVAFFKTSLGVCLRPVSYVDLCAL